jgi:hypothetical protein
VRTYLIAFGGAAAIALAACDSNAAPRAPAPARPAIASGRASGSARGASAQANTGGSAPAKPSASSLPDANGFQRMTEIPVPAAGGSAATLAYDPGTQDVYLDEPGVGLAIVDTTKKAVDLTVPAAGSPGGITFDPRYLYVAAPGQNHIQVIHKGDWAAEPGADAPAPLSGGIWTDPPRNRLYTLTERGDVLAYVAGAAPQLQSTFDLGASGPGTFAASTGTLYVASAGRVTALDVSSGRSYSDQLADASAVTGLAYDERTGLLWATAEDHHLLVLDGQSLQPPRSSGIGGSGSPPSSTTFNAPSSSAVGFDGGLRFIYTFGSGGFGAYDTNFDIQTAQVDTGDPGMSSGAVDAINHAVYTYEPSHHVLGVYSWGAHGNAYTGPGGGGGTSQTGGAGSAGGGAAGGAAVGTSAGSGGAPGTSLSTPSSNSSRSSSPASSASASQVASLAAKN